MIDPDSSPPTSDEGSSPGDSDYDSSPQWRQACDRRMSPTNKPTGSLYFQEMRKNNNLQEQQIHLMRDKLDLMTRLDVLKAIYNNMTHHINCMNETQNQIIEHEDFSWHLDPDAENGQCGVYPCNKTSLSRLTTETTDESSCYISSQDQASRCSSEEASSDSDQSSPGPQVQESVNQQDVTASAEQTCSSEIIKKCLKGNQIDQQVSVPLSRDVESVCWEDLLFIYECLLKDPIFIEANAAVWKHDNNGNSTKKKCQHSTLSAKKLYESTTRRPHSILKYEIAGVNDIYELGKEIASFIETPCCGTCPQQRSDQASCNNEDSISSDLDKSVNKNKKQDSQDKQVLITCKEQHFKRSFYGCENEQHMRGCGTTRKDQYPGFYGERGHIKVQRRQSCTLSLTSKVEAQHDLDNKVMVDKLANTAPEICSVGDSLVLKDKHGENISKVRKGPLTKTENCDGEKSITAILAMKESVTTLNNKVEESQITVSSTLEEGKTTTCSTAKEGQITSSSIVEEGQITSSSIVEEGQITAKSTVEEHNSTVINTEMKSETAVSSKINTQIPSQHTLDGLTKEVKALHLSGVLDIEPYAKHSESETVELLLVNSVGRLCLNYTSATKSGDIIQASHVKNEDDCLSNNLQPLLFDGGNKQVAKCCVNPEAPQRLTGLSTRRSRRILKQEACNLPYASKMETTSASSPDGAAQMKNMSSK